jgi:tetratricopeptide (TPR) repeat protein
MSNLTDYFDLGTHRRSVTAATADAQTWFDRGLLWTYGFNHEEAVRCFQRALESDPTCAMAHWGVAYASGPNYNRGWELFDPVTRARILTTTYAATEQALELLDHVTPVERALIKAVSARYQAPTEPDEFAVWNDDYADAMRAVHQEYPDDLDVAALFAEALLNRTPWKLWDLATGEPAPGASTQEAVEVLERALRDPAARQHPGVLHMYIHLMEMSPFPERALKAADWLRHLVPDAGHLTHMSTHIDVLCGHYRDVVVSNQQASVADRAFLECEGAMNVYTLYRIHNYHFTVYGALFLGQYEAAIAAAEELVSTVPDALLRMQVPPMADRLEGHMGHRTHVLVRFGKWQELIDTPLPDDPELYCVTTAMLHYAKGVAYAATGQVSAAEEQQRQFEEAVARVPDTRYIHNNSCLDLLAIAREMLAGELEYRKGNYDAAFAHLRQAIALDDGLPYDEPWGWMQPTRHALGALLLEQGRVEEAEAVYRADLGLDGTLARAFQHPENLWSLHGYHECLVRLGKHDLARMIGQRLELAKARADVPVHASCYCRLTRAA